MPSDAGLRSQDTDDTQALQEVLDQLSQRHQTPPLVSSPAALEAWERERRQRPDRLGSFWVGYHLPQALDATALQAEQEQRVRPWPPSLKHEGQVRVMIRTAPGLAVPVRGPYSRRQGQRRAGKRAAGGYAGLGW